MDKQEKELFIKQLAEQFFQSEFAQGLVHVQITERDAIKIKEKNGDDALHFEVCFKPTPKLQIEIAFHDHLKGKDLELKKARINKVMKEAKEIIKASKVRFRYEPEWRRYWSRLYTLYAPLDTEDVQPVLERLWVLIECLKPKLEKIRWGR